MNRGRHHRLAGRTEQRLPGYLRPAVDATGSCEWFTNGVVVSTYSGDQVQPVLAADGSHGAIIAWEDYRNGSNWDIYGSVSMPQATCCGYGGRHHRRTTGNQINPVMVEGEPGGAIVAFEDTRSGTSDIYASATPICSVSPPGSTSATSMKNSSIASSF